MGDGKDALNKYDFIYSLSVHAIFFSIIVIIVEIFTYNTVASEFFPDFSLPLSIIVIIVSAFLIKKSKKKRKYNRVLLLFFTEGWIQFFAHTRGKGALSTTKKEILYLLIFAVALLILFLIFAFVLVPQWTGVDPESVKIPSIFDLYFND